MFSAKFVDLRNPLSFAKVTSTAHLLFASYFSLNNPISSTTNLLPFDFHALSYCCAKNFPRILKIKYFKEMYYISHVFIIFVTIIRLRSTKKNDTRIHASDFTVFHAIIRVIPPTKFPKRSSGSRGEILRISRSLSSLSQGCQSQNLLTRSCPERHVSVCACACAHSQVATRGGPERAGDEEGQRARGSVMVRVEEEERAMFTRGRKRKGSREMGI